MKPTNCKQISESLAKAINHEDLHTREAAGILNLNPCYLSMALNPKSWDQMSNPAWARLEEWYNTNSPLKLFTIPAGEEIWAPKEKAKIQDRETGLKDCSVASPFAMIAKGVKAVTARKKIAINAGKALQKMAEKSLSNIYLHKIAEKSVSAPVASIKEPEDLHVDAQAAGHPFVVKQPLEHQEFTDTARMKIALDIEINLVVNGQKVQVK